jgi:hypothetical protein
MWTPVQVTEIYVHLRCSIKLFTIFLLNLSPLVEQLWFNDGFYSRFYNFFHRMKKGPVKSNNSLTIVCTYGTNYAPIDSVHLLTASSPYVSFYKEQLNSSHS